MRANQVVVSQTGNGEHRLSIELGVIKSVEQVYAAGSGSGQTGFRSDYRDYRDGRRVDEIDLRSARRHGPC